ncbi:MAG: hypothetical protein COB17_00580 [Sulfurimonas sp.]|nr:MAG: hypothetical protein COB17_00580 [Sulfurimonas sp.]
MLKKKLIISACLLGKHCRYDGKTKDIPGFIDKFKDYEIIAFCPEDPLFGTPRQKISVHNINNQNRIITNETKEDVTEVLKTEIQNFMKQHKDADTIVLKSKSPSCGLGTTPIYNEKKDLLSFGNGIAAEMFLKHFTNAKIIDELE